MKNHFIIDFETMGQNALRVPIIDASYVIFDWERFIEKPYSFEELLTLVKRSKLSIEEQVKRYGFNFKKSDTEWWMNQPADARAYVFSKDQDISVEQFFADLFEYIRSIEGEGKINYWWSRSNTFDPILLQRLSIAADKELITNEYLPFWKVRDMRTFIDAKFDFSTKNGFMPVADKDYWNKNFHAHDSRHDVAADVLRLQAIVRAEADMEMVER